MSCPAPTNKGGKLYISDQPVDCDLTLSELAVLDYVFVPGVGSIGDTGIEQDVVTYPTTDAGLTAQGKGDAVARNWDIEVLDAPSQARDILDDASAIGNDDNYATRIEWPNGDVEFSIVQVASRYAIKGAASGVRVIRYTMIPSFVPIATNALPVATSVAIGGIPFIGATLAATYSYYSPLGLPESGTEYQWYADGVAIPGETSTSLLVTGGHLGSLITFGVTPSDGLSYGHEVISVPVGPVADSARFTADAPDLYTDTALTVPVTSYGDAVAGWRGGVLVGVQPTLTARPAWGAMPSAPNTPILYYDLGDDVLPAAMELPEVTGGTLVIAGEKGIWIEDSFSHAGGSWSLGPTTYTGGPAGLLPSLIGNRVLGFAVFANSLTPAELQVEVAYWMAKGAPGVWEAGGELVTNGDFATDTVWTKGDGWSITGGQAVRVPAAAGSDISQSIAITGGSYYLSSFALTRNAGGFLARLGVPSTDGQICGSTAVWRDVLLAQTGQSSFILRGAASGADGSIDNASLKRLTLNTDPYP